MWFAADVPAHRPSIGAMGWAGAQVEVEPFKPYVYRGTGEDQFPETVTVPPPKPKPVAVDVETYRKREIARLKYAAKKARRTKQREEQRREWERRNRELRQAELRERRASIPKHVTTVFRPEVDHDEPPPPPRLVHPRRNKPIRPAAGWRPLTGADLEAFLDDGSA